jgi:predicted secreted hydrolase
MPPCLRQFLILGIAFSILLISCAPASPSAQVQIPEITNLQSISGFTRVDGSRPLHFPQDLGAHEDFSTEWWYYTGNLETSDGKHFGFELTIFRVGLVPPTAQIPADSKWYGHSLYFAHFAVSDIGGDHFYAFERYSRPGPGLAGGQASPYRVWLEDWSVNETNGNTYRLQAEQEGVALDLNLTDDMGIVLHGENGYTRGGEGAANAAYYYSQPRLRAGGTVTVKGTSYEVQGQAWKDHEFSSGMLDQNQIGWDWFSLQFEDGTALMLYQLRERDGKISNSSSGTFISTNGKPLMISKNDFEITVLDTWSSPHTQGIYPSKWNIHLREPDCVLEIQPWMSDQELHFPAVTYWEGAVHFEGTCNGKPTRGNGYIELTGYAGNLPLP